MTLDAETRAALAALPDWALAGWAWVYTGDDSREWLPTDAFVRDFILHASEWAASTLDDDERARVAALRAALEAQP